ncbi:DUF945 domain-containing protein [Nocardia sp. CDC159]|uniref:DUF945 domain-containing protein n=1 Tax=Nocardia pulmonis TaxID=2951408 RepID=A0A9X2E9K0_9NOCA|nr:MULTISPECIES: DUF932 domain-containing protein [Nocardia]MCM6776269.1 DUF945 domain-containing protein [Nocardia pulmonis]MCM6788405.1 DUF945 domain-containing protein [Nocardia sp. CDC159]
MHNLDITKGIASFADSRTDAWHQLGQQVGHAMTAAEAMREARLAGWNVRKMPLVIPQQPVITDDGVTTPPPIPVTGKYATVRTNPVTGTIDYLGVVGETYRPFQNEQSCELLDALVSESGAHFETAGALREGRETFVTMKLPEAMTLTGHDGSRDRTDFYIAALNSHDGTSAFRFLITPIRIVCANTQTAAVRHAKASFSIWHTDGATRAIAQARQALGLTFAYMEEFEAECRSLLQQEISASRVEKLAANLFAVDQATSEQQADNRRKHAGGIVKLFIESPTVRPFAGTKLGAYNAVTEYADHVMDVRGKKASAADLRAMRTLTSATVRDLKLNAFRMLQTV